MTSPNIGQPPPSISIEIKPRYTFLLKDGTQIVFWGGVMGLLGQAKTEVIAHHVIVRPDGTKTAPLMLGPVQLPVTSAVSHALFTLLLGLGVGLVGMRPGGLEEKPLEESEQEEPDGHNEP